MKCTSILAAVAFMFGVTACHAQESVDESVDKAKAAAFDGRMFGGPLGAKTHACFVRRYDAGHLAQHPKQKVSAMKLLVTAEEAPEDKVINYSFVSASSIATAPAISIPAASAIMSSPKTAAAKSGLAAASIAKAAASEWR